MSQDVAISEVVGTVSAEVASILKAANRRLMNAGVPPHKIGVLLFSAAVAPATGALYASQRFNAMPDVLELISEMADTAISRGQQFTADRN